MNDWRSQVKLSRRDAYKAACIILGLMFALIFAGWVVSRLARQQPPPSPPQPVMPTPAPGTQPVR